MLAVAEHDVERLAVAWAAEPSSLRWRRLLFSAEQALLLVRVAADSGARRGELAVLRYSDLDGRVLTIQRGVSHGVVGTTKSSRTRRLTLGSTTAALVESHWSSWLARGPIPQADWLFAPTPARERFVTADALSHKFRRLGVAAGVERPGCTGSVTPLPPNLSARAACYRRRPVSGTATRPRRCVTTPMPSPSTTKGSPTRWTRC